MRLKHRKRKYQETINKWREKLHLTNVSLSVYTLKGV
jgi:hypothetical protein